FREHGVSFVTWQARGLLVASVLIGLYMLGQRSWGWDWIHGFGAKIGEHRFAYGVYRASGLMGHPLSLAYNCMLLALLSFAQGLWLWTRDRPSAWTWIAISAVNLGLIGLTGSRYPLVLTAGLMGLGFWLGRKDFRTIVLKPWMLGLGLLAVLAISGF